MAAMKRRGGPRQRRFWAESQPREIDRSAIEKLVSSIAPPSVTAKRQSLAVSIVVKGVEWCRDDMDTSRALRRRVQRNRRALKQFKEGRGGKEIVPFNALFESNGKLFGTSSSGLYEILDEQIDGPDPYEGIDEAISFPLRQLAVAHQLAAGFKHVNPNVPFNPVSQTAEEAADGIERTAADVLLDSLARPQNDDERLAAYVYLAITQGLQLAAPPSWFDVQPKNMRRGWAYGRLLGVAAAQTRILLPTGRKGMEGLMKKGRAEAESMLEPAIEWADGRSYSAFQIEFPM